MHKHFHRIGLIRSTRTTSEHTNRGVGYICKLVTPTYSYRCVLYTRASEDFVPYTVQMHITLRVKLTLSLLCLSTAVNVVCPY